MKSPKPKAPSSPGASPPPRDVSDAHADVLHAWLVFLRSDIAATVAALNDRLASVRNATAELESPDMSRESHEAIETIRKDLTQVVALLSRMAQRVGNIAPDAVPLVVHPLIQTKVHDAHILVVEDDDAIRSALARLLMRLGHHVTSCVNGIEALEVLQLGLVDCVVSDIRMPGLGGRAFYQQVEEEWPTLASRFVFVTGDTADPRTAEFLLTTAQPVVAKPFELKTVIAAVAAVLERGRITGA